MSTHSQLQGLDLHDAFHFVQEADPGAVGSGKYWLQVSTATIRRRNDANNAWLVIGGASPVTTTKGDLIVRSATEDSRLPVGTDGQVLFADSGETLGVRWGDPSAATLPQWLIDSPDYPPTSPNAKDDEFESSATLPGGGSAKWTWDNQQSATLSIVNGHLVFTKSAQYGSPIRITQGISGTFTMTAKVQALYKKDNYNEVGLGLSDSVSGRLYTYGIATDTGAIKFFVQRWTNITTFSSAPAVYEPITQSFFYLRIQLDSTNLTFSYSPDGVGYAQVYQEAKATWLTGGVDKVAISIRPNGSATTGIYDWFRIS